MRLASIGAGFRICFGNNHLFRLNNGEDEITADWQFAKAELHLAAGLKTTQTIQTTHRPNEIPKNISFKVEGGGEKGGQRRRWRGRRRRWMATG